MGDGGRGAIHEPIARRLLRPRRGGWRTVAALWKGEGKGLSARQKGDCQNNTPEPVSARLMTLSEPTWPPTATVKGESGEKRTVYTGPCRIGDGQEQNSTALLSLSYHVHVAVGDNLGLVVGNVPDLELVVGRGRDKAVGDLGDRWSARRVQGEGGPTPYQRALCEGGDRGVVGTEGKDVAATGLARVAAVDVAVGGAGGKGG